MKNMTFADRLNLAMKMRGFTQVELAEAADMAQPSVWKLTSGKAKSSRKIVEISNALRVDPVWLSTGEGEEPDFLKSEKIKDGIPVKDFKPKEIAEWDSNTPLSDDEVEVPYYKSIELAAGWGGFGGNSDDDGYKLRFSRSTLRRYGISPKDVASFPVHGDSMEPIIPNGTTVFVNKGDKRIVDGGVYFIEQDGLLRIKLLYRQPGKLIIKSYNSVDFPDEEADPATVNIVGRVFNMSVMLI